MTINPNFGHLDKVMKKWGVKPLSEYKWMPLKSLPFAAHEERNLRDGVEMDFEDIRSLGQGPDQLLSYKGRRILVHIMHTRVWWSRFRPFLASSSNIPKVHLTWCHTLDRMKRGGRYQARYIGTTRNDGKFRLVGANGERVHKLNICQHCLGTHVISTNYPEGRPSKFPIKDFLSHRGDSLFKEDPSATYASSPTGLNPHKVARRCKNRDDWKCQECGVRISLPEGGSYLLEAHHIDEIHTNNKISNLKTLCKIHHAEIHGLHVSSEHKGRILQLWQEQGIDPTNP